MREVVKEMYGSREVRVGEELGLCGRRSLRGWRTGMRRLGRSKIDVFRATLVLTMSQEPDQRHQAYISEGRRRWMLESRYHRSTELL
jgi:hypothetical protein